MNFVWVTAMLKKGIDISHWQGEIDARAIKKAGVEFVIIKAGGDFYKDRKFESYYKSLTDAGIPVGAYYIPGFKFAGSDYGKRCADHFLELCVGKTFEYPMFLDIELQVPKNKKATTEAAVTFMDRLEKAGCYAGFYCSEGLGMELLDVPSLARFDRWVARYGGKKPTRIKNYGIWQYTDKGSIQGIKGHYVDLDYAYKDYQKIINTRGFNRL